MLIGNFCLAVACRNSIDASCYLLNRKSRGLPTIARRMKMCYDDNMKDLTFTKNQELMLDIDGYGSGGQGVAHTQGRAIFVPQAIPGERWKARILKETGSAVYAKGISLLQASPARQDTDCPYFGKCGGCDTRHLSYQEELRFKLERVNDALARIGKQRVRAERILPSDQTERYRNKAIFAVGEGGFGFFRPRSHQIIPIGDCLLQSELSLRIGRSLTAFMENNNISAYDEETGKGLVRHLFCREAKRGSDAVACVVAAGGFGSLTKSLVEHLRRDCPELTGIVLNVNKTQGNTVLAGDFYTLWGRETVEDSLCGLQFSIAPQAFFQINPPQAEMLYRQAIAYALADGPELVFDLYCGAGTISLCMARETKRVIGAEIVPQAVENARENAERNGIENAEFLCGDAGEAAAQLAARGLRPDVIVVDPPRKGMDPEAIKAVAAMTPQRIVYVSCDPATLARDILRFNDYGYRLQEATAVDMFPRTCHVECVTLMTKIIGVR